MTHQDQNNGSGAGSSGHIWLKYLLAFMLSTAALLAGTTRVGPWPESGFVSGLILLATGPLFALRMRAADSLELGRRGKPRHMEWLPWFTAAIGLIEIALVLAAATAKP